MHDIINHACYVHFILILGPLSPPLNITASSSSFTQTRFLLSWDRPINHSCINEYIVDSPNMDFSSFSTNNTNITLTSSSNESFIVRVASVDYASVKSDYSHYICIKLTGKKFKINLLLIDIQF